MPKKSAAHVIYSVWRSSLKCLNRSYFRWLAGFLLPLLLTGIACVPLALSQLLNIANPKWLVMLISPILFLLIVLPMYFSMGEALWQASSGKAIKVSQMLSLRRYGSKLRASALHIMILLPWALPLLLGIGAGAYLFYFGEDGTYILRSIISIGKAINPNEGFLTGISVIAFAFLLLILILLYGIMRNNMVRFLWAQFGGKYGNARKETLRLLKRHRGKQLLLCILLGLPLYPVIYYCGYLVFRILLSYIQSTHANIADIVDMNIFYGAWALLLLLFCLLSPLHMMMRTQFIRYLAVTRRVAHLNRVQSASNEQYQNLMSIDDRSQQYVGHNNDAKDPANNGYTRHRRRG